MKKIVGLLLSVCMAVALLAPVSANAAQTSNLIRNVEISGTEMTVFSAVPEENGEFGITLDGQALTVEAGTVQEQQLPVTVFCLVDTSGSISDFKMKLLRDTLRELSASLKEEDNMVISTVDNQLTLGQPLTTHEQREEAIQAIRSSHKDTDLYRGIVESIQELTGSAQYHTCRYLVIFSDGVEHQDNGLTEQEVLAAIQKARLPVYTVGLVQNHNERDGAKILGSFGRNSYGGMHLTTVDEGANKPLRTDVSGEEFAGAIWDSIQSGAVLKADLSEVAVDTAKTQVRLGVCYQAQEKAYEDFVDLDTGDLPVAVPESQGEAQAETQTGESEATEQEPQKKGNAVLWILLAAAAVVAVVIVVICVKKNSKKQDTDMEKIPETEAAEPLEEITHTQPIEQAAPKKQYSVFMTDIPYGQQKLRYTIPEEQPVTFGRDKRANQVLNGKDSSLSGVHFALMVHNGMYGVRDEKSLNGTYLNGVSISGRGWTKLESGDKLRVGGYEYRVIIEPMGNTGPSLR